MEMILLEKTEFPSGSTNNFSYFFLLSRVQGDLTDLILPATALTEDCYNKMFLETRILKSSELPSRTLTNGCYTYMFEGCSSLIEAPELPATILQRTCLSQMFPYCTSLREITCLATDISAEP